MKSVSKKNEPKTPLGALHRLEFILQHRADSVLRSQVGVGFGQVRIMEELSQSTARTQRELAHALYQTEANISRQLQELKNKGLVTIGRSDKDKRQRQVRLTNQGVEACQQAHKLITEIHKEALAKLDFRDAVNLTDTLAQLLKTI